MDLKQTHVLDFFLFVDNIHFLTKAKILQFILYVRLHFPKVKQTIGSGHKGLVLTLSLQPVHPLVMCCLKID